MFKLRKNLEQLLQRLQEHKSNRYGVELNSVEKEICEKAILSQLQLQDMLVALKDKGMSEEDDLYKLLDSLRVKEVSQYVTGCR